MMIAVLFCVDAEFMKHLGVAIASLLYSNPRSSFRIFVASATPLDRQEVQKVTSYVQAQGSTIEWIVYASALAYSGLPTARHITFSTYLRLFMAEYLDDTLQKVLYLDGDVLICGQIEELWQFDLGDAYLGAALEPYDEAQRSPFGFGPDDPYINAGVLLVNLNKWRSERLLQKFLEYATAHPELMVYSADQDVINCVCRGRIENIGYRWNWQALFPRMTPEALGITALQFAQLRRSPKIIHYTSLYKPWYYRWEPHYKDRYWKLLKRTPWASYVPPDKQVRYVPGKVAKVLQRSIEWHCPSLARKLRQMRFS